MGNTVRTLRAVQWAMLASILLYGVVGELAGPHSTGVEQAFSYIFSCLAVALVGTIFIVRRTLVLQAELRLSSNPEDALSLRHWKNGYIATYALCEVLGLFGLVLRFRGAVLAQSALFYLGAFALLFFFRPRRPVAAQPGN
jgi:hypothetical protein